MLRSETEQGKKAGIIEKMMGLFKGVHPAVGIAASAAEASKPAAPSAGADEAKKGGVMGALGGFFSSVKKSSTKKVCPTCGQPGKPGETVCSNPSCKGANLINEETGVGKALKAGTGLVVYGASVISTLFFAFSEKLAGILETFGIAGVVSNFAPVDSMTLAQIIIIGTGLLITLGLVYLIYKKKAWWSVGLFIAFMAIVVGLFLAEPITDMISSLATGGVGGFDISSIMCIFNSADPSCLAGPSQDVSFTGLKSYDTLRVTLGNQRYSDGNIVYEVPTVYAGEMISLPFTIKNTNKRSGEGGGLTFTGIVIGTGKPDDRTNSSPDVKATHVWAYPDRAVCSKNCNVSLYEAQSIDRCTSEEPCVLGPEEEVKVYAEGFAGGSKGCIARGYPCNEATASCTKEKNCPDNYDGVVPCDDKDIQQLEFEVSLKYESSVEHKRTLVVVESEDVLDRLPRNSVPSLREEVPTDGPLDIVLDFDSPFVIGKMNTLNMKVDVVNGGSGDWIPKTDLEINTIGPFPSWIQDGSESDKCKLEDGKITISKGDFGGGSLLISGTRAFLCKLKIDPVGAGVDINDYKDISFVGNLTYSYVDENKFFGGTNIVEVDRCSMCPNNQDECGDFRIA